VELRRFTQHSCQLGLIRCSDAGVDMLGKAENSMPIMAIPGPRQPTQHQWAAIFTLLVSVFTRCSPGGKCAAPFAAAYKLWAYTRLAHCTCLAIISLHHAMLKLIIHLAPLGIGTSFNRSTCRHQFWYQSHFQSYADAPMNLQVPLATPGTFQAVEILPVLTGLHADFIMRCHLTMWKAPGGHFSGGWCRCKITSPISTRFGEVCFQY
jgi:hypothetical protein